MNVDTASQQDLKDRLTQLAKDGREGYREAYRLARLGQKQPNDAQFMQWWNLHTEPMGPNGQPNPSFDPNWQAALLFVEGGKQILARHQRLTAPPKDPVAELMAEAGYHG